MKNVSPIIGNMVVCYLQRKTFFMKIGPTPPHLRIEPFSDNRKVKIAIELPTPSFRCRMDVDGGIGNASERAREISKDLWCEYINLLTLLFRLGIFTHKHREGFDKAVGSTCLLSLSLRLPRLPLSHFLHPH